MGTKQSKVATRTARLRRASGLVLLSMALSVSTLASRAEAQEGPPTSRICPKAITYRGDKIRYCRTHALSSRAADPNVTRAVVFIHGAGRDAPNYFDRIRDDAEDEGVLEQTVIVAPQFNFQADLEAFGLGDVYAYWGNGWKYGHRSANGSRISSFEYVDLIVQRLAGYHPNLEHIAVVGHSAGGRFVQRYAGGGLQTEIDGQSVEAFLAAKGVTYSFGVSAPGNFMWLSEERPDMSLAARCPNFDRYEDGLADLAIHSYMGRLTAERIRRNYFARHVYHLIGSRDTALSSADCATRVQGTGRYDAMVSFLDDARRVCETLYADQGLHRAKLLCHTYLFKAGGLFEVESVGHNSRQLFDARAGRDILFHLR